MSITCWLHLGLVRRDDYGGDLGDADPNPSHDDRQDSRLTAKS